MGMHVTVCDIFIRRLHNSIIKLLNYLKLFSSLLTLEFFDRNFIPTIKIKEKKNTLLSIILKLSLPRVQTKR